MKQRSIGFFAYAVITAVILSSCALILPELDIMSWSPGNDEPVNIDDLIISVEFSREPDHVLAEEAFSLTNQDGNTVNGRFSWEGSSLRLTPYSSLEANIEYSIKVETSVEDAYGGSLNEAFYKSFRTGSEGVRPVVEAVYPADRAVISSRNASVTVTFDRQMDFESVLKGFSISPDISGVSLLNDSGRVFSFTPAELWSLQQEYNIKISTDAASSVGYSIGSEYETSFTVSSDLTPPSVISVSTVDDATILADSIINTGWEKNSAIAVYFSEEVDQDSAESSVTLEPAASFDVDFDDSVTPARMIISFDDNLEWHTVYRLSISTALTDAADNAMEDSVVRRFFIDGASSMPPSVAKADFAPAGGSTVCFYNAVAPASDVSSDIILDTSGGDALQNPFYFDFYFDMSDGAQLPFFGFTENFLISPSDSCISITYLNFELYNPGDSVAAAAAPQPLPDADQAVVRLVTSVTDSAAASGSILFKVYSDLTDSLGNSMLEDWSRELSDEDN